MRKKQQRIEQSSTGTYTVFKINLISRLLTDSEIGRTRDPVATDRNDLDVELCSNPPQMQIDIT